MSGEISPARNWSAKLEPLPVLRASIRLRGLMPREAPIAMMSSVPFGGRASAADRRVEQFVTLVAYASGEPGRGLGVSGSVVDDDSARPQAGDQAAVFEDLANVRVVGDAKPDEFARPAEVRHVAVGRVRDIREYRERAPVSCPDVQRPSGLRDRSSHGRALIAETDEANIQLG